MDAHETLLTPNEAAEILRLSPFTIANMLRAGALPGQKLGRLWRIRLADLDAYIVAGSEAAAAWSRTTSKSSRRSRASCPGASATRV